MKLLTTEQLGLVLSWARSPVKFDSRLACALTALISAECRAHGFKGIDDAYKHLIEEK